MHRVDTVMSEIDAWTPPRNRSLHAALLEQKYYGGVIGSALGDALGEIVLARSFSPSIIDADNLDSMISETELLRLIHFFEHLECTDDTHMALGIAEVLIAHAKIDSESLGMTFVRNYGIDGDDRGYGPNTRALLVSQLLKLSPGST